MPGKAAPLLPHCPKMPGMPAGLPSCPLASGAMAEALSISSSAGAWHLVRIQEHHGFWEHLIMYMNLGMSLYRCQLPVLQHAERAVLHLKGTEEGLLPYTAKCQPAARYPGEDMHTKDLHIS